MLVPCYSCGMPNTRNCPRGTPLPPELLTKLQGIVTSAGSIDAASRRLDIPNKTVRSALDGRNLYPATLCAFIEAVGRLDA